jgi:transposase
MCLRITNIQHPACHAYLVNFESAGALERNNEHSGAAAESALYIAFAPLKQTCPMSLICVARWMMKHQQGNDFAAFIGIDWADEKHDICLQPADSGHREFEVLPHRPDAIERWAVSLRQRFQGRPVAVCLEIAKGPLVYALQKYDFLILFPVNPATLAKYRQAFTPSHAKDDPTDAEYQLELLVYHRDKLKTLNPQSVPMRTLQSLVEQRRRLADDVKRITNRLISTLKQYYPQAVQWFDAKDTLLFCDFLERWPSLKHVKQARRATLVSFFHERHVRSAKLIEDRILAIRATNPLTEDPAIIGPHQLLTQALVEQLRVTLLAVDRFDSQINAVSQTLPDYPLFSALPGAGAVLAPRLLAAFGEQRERYQNAAELQKYAGVAPVTERSGKQHWVHWRLQCPTFMRQTFVEWASQTITRSFWAGAYYRQQRVKGSSHQAALRALAFKWIRILYRCWQTRTAYDESKYLHALKRRGSPLLHTPPQTAING